MMVDLQQYFVFFEVEVWMSEARNKWIAIIKVGRYEGMG